MSGMIEKNTAIYSDGGKSVIISPEGIEIKGGLTNMPKGTKVLSLDGTRELLAQDNISAYKCNVKK